MNNSLEGKARVVVLGANGQVGVELCYLLSTEPSIHPVAVARSEYSLALLRKMGLECSVAASEEDLANMVKGCDAVVDLAHPWQTNLSDMRKAIIRRCKLLQEQTSPGVPIIYASTLAVYHLNPGRPAYTVYGRTKQLAERVHLRLGRQKGHAVFVLRLGEVHGALQGSSLSLMQTFRISQKITVPDIKSITVFVSTISEAITQIVAGAVLQGTYSLVSPPEWSYVDLALWLAEQAGVSIDVRTEPIEGRALLGRLTQSAKRTARSYALKHKDQIIDWMWPISPEFVRRVAFAHTRNLAAAQIAACHDFMVARPFSQKIVAPGLRIASLSDARVTMPPKHALMKQAMARLTT